MPDKKKAELQQAAGKETLVYLGPEIPGVISSGMVLNNGLTPQMKNMTEECPAFGRLFVAIGKVVKAKKELKNKTSAVTACYNKAVEYAAQKGVKK